MGPDAKHDETAADGAWYDESSVLAGRWAVTPRRHRLAFLAAAAGLVVAVVLGAFALRARPTVVTRTVTAPVAHHAPTVDASGCPVGTTCDVIGGQPATAQLDAIRTEFPDAVIEAATTTVRRSDRHVLRSTVVARIGQQDSLAVWSACVPGTATPDDRTENAARIRLTFGGDTVVLSRLLSVHRHGAPGCSVVVEVDSVGSEFLWRDAAVRLAGDERLRVGT